MSSSDESPLPNGRLTLRIFPQLADTNSNGDISGGWVLSKMDIAAEETARATANGSVTMVATESTSFLSPVKTGSALCCYTRVNEIGQSSIQVNIEVWTQNVLDNSQQKVCDSTFIYVAIDEAGHIRAVPK